MILVDPNKVLFDTRQLGKGDGTPLSGNWDAERVRTLEEIHLYQCFLASLKGKQFDPDTELGEELAEMRRLYDAIKGGGYKDTDPEDRVGVNVGREGAIHFDLGFKRFVCARLLEVPEIPVNVHNVHVEWQSVMNEVQNHANYHDGKVESPVLHPMLTDVPSVWGHDRFEAIRRSLDLTEGTVLDLGAEWGYMSQRFEQEGFRVTAVESDRRVFQMLHRLKVAMGLTFEAKLASALDLKGKQQYDVVLALNLLHYFIKSQKQYKQLVSLLNRVDAKVMYFQAHSSEDRQMVGAYRNFAPEEFVEFLVQETTFTDYEQVYTNADGIKPIFRLYREAKARKRVAFVVGDGIGNQVEAIPALLYAKRKYGCKVSVCNTVPSSMGATKVIFEGLADSVCGKGAQKQLDRCDGQIVTMMCKDDPLSGVPLLNVQEFGDGRFSEVEANMRAVGRDYDEVELGDVGDAFSSVEPAAECPDVLIHDGYSKVTSVARARWEAKSYPHYAELVTALKEAGYTVGSIGAAGEHVAGTEDLTGRSLEESVALIKAAKLLIANDTGTYHIACVVGTKTLVLFTFTDLTKNYDPRFHRSAVVVTSSMDCAPCQFRSKYHDYWMSNRAACKWACREVPLRKVLSQARALLGGSETHFVTAITTYNRCEYLKRNVESWDATRNHSHKWTLIVADDGSTDGTLDYLEGLRIPGVEVRVIRNQRRGVHYQTNQILREVQGLDFTFAFKTDDDLLYLAPGWDDAYYQAAMATGFHHLAFADAEWMRFHGNVSAKPEQDHASGILSSKVKTEMPQGAFWTFTPDVLRDVGFFDLQNFGLCGYGHIDYTLRCCRAGYNDPKNVCDLKDSSKYLRLVLQKEGYRSAVNDAARAKATNTQAEMNRKIQVMRQDRRFVGYNEIGIDMDKKPVENGGTQGPPNG